MINTLIVEDHEIARLGLSKILERIADVNVVAEASTGQGALSRAMEVKPDLILMDIGLPDLDGVEVTRLVKKELNCKVILITVHDEEDDVLEGISAGADAYCLKDIKVQQLEEAIYCVMSGGVWLDKAISMQISKIIQSFGVQKSLH